MKNTGKQNSVHPIEIFLAKCYIFFLPLRMPLVLTGILSPFGAQAEYFDFLIFFLGVAAYFFLHRFHLEKQRKEKDRVVWSFGEALMVFFVLSFIMTWYVFITYGRFNGNSPFLAVVKMLLNYAQYLVMLIYSRYILSIISPDEVLKTLHASIVFLLIIGLIQLGDRYGIFPDAVYNLLSSALNLAPRHGEIALTTMERSHAAIIMGTVIFPFYFSKILNGEKLKWYMALELLLWFILALSGESSTMYLMVGAQTGVMLIWMTFRRSAGIGIRILTIFASVLMVVILIYPEIIDKLFGVDFSYLVFEKANDSNNQSSAERTAAINANILIFKRFPIFGCGNGLQGYFYKDYDFLIHGKKVLKTGKELFSGKANYIANGASFLFGMLSGWGLFGAAAFLRFIVTSIKTIIGKRKNYSVFMYFYLLALIGVVISGIKSEFVGLPFIWFVLAFPAINYSMLPNRLSQKP